MNRENNFTIIHIFGALLVIIGHQYVLMGLGTPTIMGWAPHTVGVRVLFLISGYLVSMSYMRKHSRKEYLIKRISRLYPGLIVCLLITILGLYFFSTKPEMYWASAKLYLLSNLAMRPVFALTGVFESNIAPSVNGSLWTLPVELICYIILIPILDIFKAVEKRNAAFAKIGFLVILVSLSIFLCYYETNMAGKILVFWGTDLYSLLPLLLWFLIGCGYYILDLKKYCNLQLACVIALFFFLFTGTLRNLMLPYVWGYLVMSFALTKNPIFARAVKHDVCYGLYLFSFPVQQMLLAVLESRPGINVTICIALTIAITWVLAEITYRFIEIPAANATNKLLNQLKLSK